MRGFNIKLVAFVSLGLGCGAGPQAGMDTDPSSPTPLDPSPPPPASCPSSEAGAAQVTGTSVLGPISVNQAWWGASQCRLRIVLVGTDELLVIETPAGVAWDGAGLLDTVRFEHVVDVDAVESEGFGQFEVTTTNARGDVVQGMIEVTANGWGVEGAFLAHHCEAFDWVDASCE